MHGRSACFTAVRQHHFSGSVAVEMAIVAPLLIFLLFAIIEAGWLAKDCLILGSACREATRVASLGRSCSQVITSARNSATLANTNTITAKLEYQLPGASTWSLLGDSAEGANTAPPGSQIRVTLTYPHTLVCGPVASLFADAGKTTRTLHATMIAMRE